MVDGHNNTVLFVTSMGNVLRYFKAEFDLDGKTVQTYVSLAASLTELIFKNSTIKNVIATLFVPVSLLEGLVGFLSNGEP